jgi:ParB-like chromosome segregation protein Spo0J
MTTSLQSKIKQYIKDIKSLNTIREYIYSISPMRQPIDLVRWVPIEDVQPNNYNPNSVARKEMSLLYRSIKEDGYTQPVVTFYDEKLKKYIIVDGFHRYFVCKNMKDIYERNQGMLPCVVIDKPIEERMASTIRHNRARGEHSVTGMSNIVFKMLQEGVTDAEICNKLGMEAEELLRLKHVTGFAKLFQDIEYGKAWKHRNQIALEKRYREMKQQQSFTVNPDDLDKQV